MAIWLLDILIETHRWTTDHAIDGPLIWYAVGGTGYWLRWLLWDRGSMEIVEIEFEVATMAKPRPSQEA